MDPNTQELVMGAAGASGGPKVYVEDVFSTYLYTGNGSTQTITNGIDLSGKGGLVWIKNRSQYNHVLADTARGTGEALSSNTTAGSTFSSADVTAFNANGFSLGANGRVNQNDVPNGGGTFVSWTFRKAAKFFDVVIYTGNGTAGRTISHNLGSTPGCIIVKRTDTTGNWVTYHRSIGATGALFLNSTQSTYTDIGWFNNTIPTSSVFTVGSDSSVNANGGTYVAYLFAHDAGGFGDSGNDNVISCGSFTTNGSGVGTLVSLGWEPQWLIYKSTVGSSGWKIADAMRGIPTGGNDPLLIANSATAENASNNEVDINATGFQLVGNGNLSDTYIYIAIRRGPMKTPTDATKVFTSVTNQNNFTNGVVTTGFPVDMHISIPSKDQNGDNHTVEDRLRSLGNSNSVGQSPNLKVDLTSAEVTNQNPWFYSAWNTTIVRGSNGTGTSPISWFFRRAPGFFDVVAYAGDGDVTARTVTHGLTVQPELMIFKDRNAINGWDTYVPSGASNYSLVRLNTNGNRLVANISRTNASSLTTLNVGWLSGNVNGINEVGNNYIAYLFATCPGVSKVGSYNGTGTTQQINCNFTNGARFVLIKRTDSTGDWYVWDSARGIIPGNDPYLLLNSTAAEVTNTDYIDTYSAGFEISSSAPAAINANGGSYIFLAIA